MLVAAEGEILLTERYGYANWEKGIRNIRPNLRFWIAFKLQHDAATHGLRLISDAGDLVAGRVN